MLLKQELLRVTVDEFRNRSTLPLRLLCPRLNRALIKALEESRKAEDDVATFFLVPTLDAPEGLKVFLKTLLEALALAIPNPMIKIALTILIQNLDRILDGIWNRLAKTHSIGAEVPYEFTGEKIGLTPEQLVKLENENETID